MPLYRVHRIKDAPAEVFRWAAHSAGPALVKLKDYEIGFEIDALHPYHAWQLLRQAATPLRPGDLLEPLPTATSPASLFIAKYVGFEPATWSIPELNQPESSFPSPLAPQINPCTPKLL